MAMASQRWIAFDQWCHTLYDSSAMADETFSARCWRETKENPSDSKWAGRVRRIDAWALKLFKDKNHCYNSFMSEMNRKQLPSIYRNK